MSVLNCLFFSKNKFYNFALAPEISEESSSDDEESDSNSNPNKIKDFKLSLFFF